jgi:hypothetical protein
MVSLVASALLETVGTSSSTHTKVQAIAQATTAAAAATAFCIDVNATCVGHCQQHLLYV